MSKIVSICGAVLLSLALACGGNGSSSGGGPGPGHSNPALPSITTQPESQTITAGQSVTFSVVATSTETLHYRWKKDSTNVGTDSESLNLDDVQASDAGSYTVTISNSAGAVISDAATLTVVEAAVAPSITAQPQSQTITVGQDASFTVVATGTAPLHYQWKKGASNIGTDSATLALNNVQTSDTGSYTVTVSNSGGNVTSNAATLTVTAAPVAPAITTQPVSQSVAAGQSATFTVVATGTAPLHYQWKKGTTNVGTDSATLPLTNVQTSNAGSYTVTITNSAGNVTSNPATLTVKQPPVISHFTASPSVIPSGGTSTLNWTVSGATTITIDQGIGSVSASGSQVVSPAATTIYTLTATNNDGNSTANTTVTISSGTTGWLYTKPGNNKIYVNNGSGETVWMGRGVNMDDMFLGGYNWQFWMGTASAEQELTDTASHLINDWKANLVRVVMGMNSYDPTVSWLTSTAQYREPMERVINSIGAHPGAYVIANVRSDTTMTGCDQGDDAICVPASATDAVYKALVDSFHDKPYVLFGVSNEPGGNSLSYSQLRSAMSHVVDIIRAREDYYGDPHHIVLVQGNSWTSDISFYSASPLSQDNVAYEYHSYPPEITGTYGYTYSNIPVIVGEYGGNNFGSFTQAQANTFYPDWESKQISNLAWYFSPFSAVTTPLLVITTNGNDIQPSSWGTIVKNYLTSHAQ